MSLPILRNYDMQLRNATLRFIKNIAYRHILSRDFPTGGRALLAHLRNLALQPLTTSEVNSVLVDIKTLTESGLKRDDVAAFREWGVIYHRILARIPDSNPSKDTPAMQAMRYIQAVIRNRPTMGQSIMNHFSSHHVNQNDPIAVPQ